MFGFKKKVVGAVLVVSIVCGSTASSMPLSVASNLDRDP